MANVVNIEWLNQNSLRNYPIRENLKCIPYDTYGNLCSADYALPKFLIVDFVLAVNSTDITSSLFVKQLSTAGNIITLVFASIDRYNQESVVAVITVDVGKHTPYTAYPIYGSGSFDGAIGSVTLGDLTKLPHTLPDGIYQFASSQTMLEPRCIRPAISGVTSLSIMKSNTTYESRKITGDIKLVAGTNIFLDYVPEENAIIISAKDGVGYTDECECARIGDSRVKSINGIQVKNVQLIGDECMTITSDPEAGTITITDTCAKPCCGCPELTFVNNTINSLFTSMGNLNTFAVSLQEKLNSFILNYLTSSN